MTSKLLSAWISFHRAVPQISTGVLFRTGLAESAAKGPFALVRPG
jgi:hypothetical protein